MEVKEERCTKEHPCIPAEIKENEVWIHEDAYDMYPDIDMCRFFKCPNCGIEFDIGPDVI